MPLFNVAFVDEARSTWLAALHQLAEQLIDAVRSETLIGTIAGSGLLTSTSVRSDPNGEQCPEVSVGCFN